MLGYTVLAILVYILGEGIILGIVIGSYLLHILGL